MGTLQLVGTQPQLEKQSVSVLLLEDSAFDAALISEQLQLVFLLHDFQRVDNRADFIAALHVHEWDLILADMNLPDFDGIAALELAAELAPEVPFIFVSATIGEELAIDSMKRGATDYVLKQRLSRLSLVAGRAVTAHRDNVRLRTAAEALRHAEKLAVAGRLAATIAHEINNPLEASINLLYLVSHDPDTQRRDLQDTINLLEEQLLRVMRISQQTLGFYRESQQPVPVDLSRILNVIADLYQRKFESSGINLICQIEPDLRLYGFPGEIHQLVTNLVGNALDATSRGGTACVHAKSCLNARTSRPELKLVVSDTGHGIHRDKIDRIFEPFFTTKGERGTGLGLWVTHGIVHKHKGTIQVTSDTAQDHGTTFTVFLPSQLEARPDSMELSA